MILLPMTLVTKFYFILSQLRRPELESVSVENRGAVYAIDPSVGLID